MADLYYIDEDYYNPSLGYFVYTADAAAAPSSNFTLGCDATVVGAATEANAALTSTATISATATRIKEATAAIASTATISATATVGKETSVALTSTATATATATRIQEASAAFTSAFAPSLSVEVFKNSFAVLDCPSVLTMTPSVNRSITQALDNIATLNAMAARTRDLASSLDSTSTLTTSVTALKSSSANLTSTATLSADALNLQLASASLVSATTLDTDRYFGSARPRDGFAGTFNYDTSVKKFGTASLTNSDVNFRPFGQNNIYDTTLIPSKTESFILDAWLYFPSGATGTGRYLAFNTSNGVGGIDFLRIDISVTARTIRFRDFGATSNPFDFTSSAQSSNTWLYVAMVKSGTTMSAYIDTARVHTVTNSVYTNTGVPWGGYQEQGQGFEIIAGSMKVDEVSFNVGTTLGISPSDSTITVPTTARVNDPDTTRFLYHFDSTDLDDITVTALASAALTSTATLSASATKTTGTSSAALTSATTLSASVIRVLEATAALSTTATQTATATRIPSTAQADLSTTATLACAISVTRDSASALSSSTVQTVDYTRTRSAASAFTSAFSPTLDVTAQRAGVALLESVTALSALTARTREVTAGLTSTATVAANAGRLIGLASSMASASTLAIDYLHLVGVSASLASEFSTSTSVSRTRAIASAITATTALTADASRTRILASDLNTTATQSATGTRIQPGSSALAITATLDASAVKTATATATIASVVTQSTQISKTVDPQIATSAIATELVVAFKNATGTITMESTATLTMSIGRLRQLDRNRNFGVISNPSSSIPRLGPLSGLPFAGLKWNTAGLTVSIWARRKTTNTFNVLWTYDNRPSSATAIGALVIDNNNIRLRNYFDADEPGATWPNQAPVDTDWHNYVFQCDRQSYFKLWLDGVYLGESNHGASMEALVWNNASYIRFGSGLDRSAGLQYDETETGDENLDFAQIWVGIVPVEAIPGTGGAYSRTTSGFNPLDFYNSGFVDLGDNGRGEFNQLPTPYIYNRLSGAYTYQYGVSGSETTFSVSAAGTALFTPTAPINSRLTVEGATILILGGNLSATSTLTAQANSLANAVSQLQTTATETATASITRTATSAVSVTATLSTPIARTRSVSSNFESIFTEMVVIGKLSADISLLGTSFTLEVEGTVIEPIRTSANLASQSTLSANGTAFTGITAALAAQTLVVADITVKPPIRITADLTSVVTVTATIGSIEQFAVLTVSSGTLVCVVNKIITYSSQPSAAFTATSTARRLAGLAAALNCQGFVITVGEVVNIDPFTTYLVPQETRAYYILEESREYLVEQETRVNIIQGYQT